MDFNNLDENVEKMPLRIESPHAGDNGLYIPWQAALVIGCVDPRLSEAMYHECMTNSLPLLAIAAPVLNGNDVLQALSERMNETIRKGCVECFSILLRSSDNALPKGLGLIFVRLFTYYIISSSQQADRQAVDRKSVRFSSVALKGILRRLGR